MIKEQTQNDLLATWGLGHKKITNGCFQSVSFGVVCHAPLGVQNTTSNIQYINHQGLARLPNSQLLALVTPNTPLTSYVFVWLYTSSSLSFPPCKMVIQYLWNSPQGAFVRSGRENGYKVLGEVPGIYNTQFHAPHYFANWQRVYKQGHSTDDIKCVLHLHINVILLPKNRIGVEV